MRVEAVLRHQVLRGFEHGHRDCTDIARSGCDISVVFDVGANVGQSAKKFSDAFGGARIYSFEPATGTFVTLEKALRECRNVSCHRLAFGRKDGDATLFLTGAADANSSTNSLIEPRNPVATETVVMRTIDSFAREARIPRLDLLKIDAEGFDLEVLIGARAMLSQQMVAFVLIEVGFDPADKRHVLFDDVRSFLSPFGFSVFGFYEQQPEWSGEKRLRYANACFSNESAFLPRG
ncbi:MAG TPA: FkbM family methyltransferase [Gemmatimonadaceae bacterium]|nr:FkbM family methyltransferase [Gemmatimonadaceae bacterium]